MTQRMIQRSSALLQRAAPGPYLKPGIHEIQEGISIASFRSIYYDAVKQPVSASV